MECRSGEGHPDRDTYLVMLRIKDLNGNPLDVGGSATRFPLRKTTVRGYTDVWCAEYTIPTPINSTTSKFTWEWTKTDGLPWWGGQQGWRGFVAGATISVDGDCGENADIGTDNKDKQETGLGGCNACSDKNEACGLALSGKPVNITTGNMFYKAPSDIAVAGRSLNIDLTRTYNSQGKALKPFGSGWSFSYGARVYDATYNATVQGPDGRAHFFGKRADGTFFNTFGARGQLIGDTINGYGWEYNGKIYEFDPSGLLTQVTLPTGDYAVIAYAASTDKISSITLENGRGYAFAYTADVVEYAYALDGSGNPEATPARAYSYQSIAEGVNHLLTKVRDGEGNLIEEYIYEPIDIWTDNSNYPPNIIEIRRYVDSINYVVIERHTYDNSDRALTSEVGPDGSGLETRTIDYSVEGQVTITDSKNNQEVRTFSGPWKVESATGDGCGECGGDITTVSYDPDGHPISYTDKNGNLTSLDRDSGGNVVARTEALGTAEERTTSYTYHPDYDLVTSVTTDSILNPGNNHVLTYDYHNAQGNTTPYLYKVTDDGFTRNSSGATVSYHYETLYDYNVYGQVTTIDGPRTVADTTTYDYDPLTGNLLSVTDPVGNVVSFSNYDNLGKPGTITDANNVATTFSYDAEGRITRVERTATGEVTTYSYHFLAGSDLLESVTMPGGNILNFTYDDALNMTTITDALGNSIAYSYDTEGNRTAERVYDNSMTLRREASYVYNTLDRLWKAVNFDGSYTEYGYDPNGNREMVITPDGRRVDYTFDALDRLKTSVRDMGTYTETTNYGYDPADNLIAVTDDNGNATSYVYDDAGRLVQTSSPDTGTTKYAYDEAGNLIYKEDAQGIVTQYAYDAANRLISVSYPSDPTLNVTYEYDLAGHGYGLGRLCRMTDITGVTDYTYDAAGRVVTETRDILGIQYITSYSYYLDGALQSVTYPTGRVVTYTRDVTGAVTGATADDGGQVDTLISNTTPHPFGGYDSLTFGNGVANTFSYDLDGRLTALSAGSFMSRIYSRLSGGDIDAINDVISPVNSLSYGYDPAGRLNGASGAFGSMGYTYDGVGNRQLKDDNSQQTVYTYLPGSNILDYATGAEAEDFNHNLAGNMTLNGNLNLAYNAAGRLFEVDDAGTIKGRYFYNGQGQRAIKDECRVFIYDLSGNIIGEYMTDGTMVAEVVYADGMRVAEYRDVNAEASCTPSDSGGGLTGEGFYLSNQSDFATTTSIYFNTQTLYTLVWSDQVDKDNITEATAQLKGAKGTRGNYTLAWDAGWGAFMGSYDMGQLNISKGGNSWDWSATLTDSLGGSYSPKATLTITEGSAMTAFGGIYAAAKGGGPKAPVVNSVDPTSGSTGGGDIVTVNGRNFEADATVQFGIVYSPNVTFVSNKVLSVETPAHGAGAVDITVTNPGVGSDTLPSAFTFVSGGPAPSISSIDPTTGDITGGQTVAVYGANFVSGATVEFGGASSPSVVFVSSAELSVTTPAHAEGVVDVTVTNPDQQSDTLASAYTYTDSSGIPDVRLHYYHNDHLGTPLFLTDAYGTVVWEGLYKPFGDLYYENTDPDGDGSNVYQPFRFPGQYEDFEKGLYYNYFRDYDSQLGRYIQADPIGLAGGLHLFNYANLSTVNNTDYLGLRNSRSGGAYHPPSGVKTKCRPYDPCPLIRGKIWVLGRMINSHVGWDKHMPAPRGGNRHATEINDLHVQLANCQSLYESKCKDYDDCLKRPIGEKLSNVQIAVAGAGTAYVTYRIVRMAPSFVFPQLWWTVPINATSP